MKILLIGDVFGAPGRDALARTLDGVVAQHDVDAVVCNAENAAGGFGLTRSIAKDLFALGCHLLTGGNHTWDKIEILQLLEDDERILRPHNYPAGNPGSGIGFLRIGRHTVAVLNLQGRVFMPPTDCPFAAADRALADLRGQCDAVLVELHAEATSEKRALAWHLDGRVAAVVGTHTHVQTADEEILPGGTAYLSDLGMTGAHRSVIGGRIDGSLARFLDGRPRRIEPADGDLRLHGAVVQIDPSTGRALGIERVQVRLKDK